MSGGFIELDRWNAQTRRVIMQMRIVEYVLAVILSAVGMAVVAVVAIATVRYMGSTGCEGVMP